MANVLQEKGWRATEPRPRWSTGRGGSTEDDRHRRTSSRPINRHVRRPDWRLCTHVHVAPSRCGRRRGLRLDVSSGSLPPRKSLHQITAAEPHNAGPGAKVTNCTPLLPAHLSVPLCVALRPNCVGGQRLGDRPHVRCIPLSDVGPPLAARTRASSRVVVGAGTSRPCAGYVGSRLDQLRLRWRWQGRERRPLMRVAFLAAYLASLGLKSMR